MCGIAGFFAPSPSRFQARLPGALRLIDHRGPDDTGMEFFGDDTLGVGFGSNRLAIVDLSPAGHMPMVAPDGAHAIVYNGEVYNAAELRESLRARGVTFRSHGDTEIVLRGLALDGPAFLDRVDGMYALAFWNARERSVLLARDRFGEKPLFIRDLPEGGMLFASEIRPLLALGGGTPDVDRSVLYHVLAFGYPPSGRSIFADVRKLPPGSWEIHGGPRPRRGTLAPLDSTPEIDSVRSLGGAAALLYDRLRTSVRDRMIADVPVGVFLSGGSDSAAVAALAAQALPPGERLNTYTVGYPGSKFSELDPARRVAEHLKTKHHEIPLDETHLAALPFVVASLGEPIADAAALPTYFLSVAARDSSTVLLTGEGSDEILFGYPRYGLHDLAGAASRGNLIARLAAKLPLSPFKRLRQAHLEPLRRDAAWRSNPLGRFGLGGNGAARWATQGGLGELDGDDAQSARLADLRVWMPESVLPRLDRMSMAASIEARAPFLGNEIARLGFHLPRRVLRRFPYGKIALRTALAKEYGVGKAWGMKRPFAVPIVDWLGGPLRTIHDETFLRGRLAQRGWFDASALRSVGEAILAGDESASRIAWTLVTIELWARAFLDGEWPEAPDRERYARRFRPAEETPSAVIAAP